jgi:hypothetical protein
MTWQAMSARPCHIRHDAFQPHPQHPAQDRIRDGKRVQNHHGVAAQVEIESKIRKQFMIFQFQAPSSRRFQRMLIGSTCTGLPRCPPAR